jgi:hypothetical protein
MAHTGHFFSLAGRCPSIGGYLSPGRRVIVVDMNRKTSLTVMMSLTFVFGAVIAILAMLGVGDIGVIAGIGAVILALGWSFFGILGGRKNNAP